MKTVLAPGSGYVNPGVMYARSVTLHHNGDANGTIVSPAVSARPSSSPALHFGARVLILDEPASAAVAAGL